MSGALGNLVVEVSANVARFQSDMGKVAQIAEQRAQQVDKALGLVATSLKAMGAGLVAGLTIDKVKDKINGAIEAAAGLQQLSERTGATVEGLSALASVAKLSGTDADALAGGLQKLSKSMVDAQSGGAKSVEAFRAIGISTKELIGLKPDAAFLLISNRLAEYADGAGKTALAQQLLGKSGANLLPTMKDLADVGEYQVKVTAEQARMADEYEKSQKKLAAAQGAVFKIIAMELVPVYNAFTLALLDSIQANNGLRKAAGDLAKDGSIRSWAEDAAVAFAIVIETVQGLGKGLSALASSFQVVGADMSLMWKIMRAPPNELGEWLSKGTGELAKFKAERDKVLNSANAKWADAIGFDSRALEKNIRERFAMGRQSAIENRGWNPMQRPDVNFNTTAGDAKSPGQGFLDQLKRQLEQQEKGRFEMLRLEAVQKGVSAAAAPYIMKLEEIELRQERIKRIVAEVGEQEAQRAKVTGLIQGGNDAAKSLIQQTELIGMNANEQRRLTELRKIDEIVQKSMVDAGADTRQELMRLADVMRGNVIRALDELEKREADVSGSFGQGWKTAGEAYIKNARDQATFAENLITGSLKRAEDAFINFAKTGKINLGSLFSFMAEEYLRNLFKMQASKAMTDNGGNLLSLGSIFSTVGGWFGFGHANGLSYVPYDNYPAVLHEGEKVLTKQEAQGSSGGPSINITNGPMTVGSGVSRAEFMSALRASQAQTIEHIRRLDRHGRFA